MAYTLQRKMFKMGGSVAHGGGVTSGLKLNKGGSVQEPQATFGVGNNANKTIGPDGKVREANFAFMPLLAPGAATALRLAPRLISGLRSGKGLEALSRFFRVKPTGARGPGTFSPGSKASIDDVLKNIKSGGGDFSKVAFKPGQRAVTYGDRARQATRIGGATLAGGAGLGAISSLFERADDSPQDTLGENIFEGGRSVAETALDVMGYIPSTIAQAPFRKLEDIQGLSGGIRTALYGAPEKSKIGEITGAKVAAAEVKSKEDENAEMLANLRDRSDAYLKLLNDEGRQDMTIGNIGRALSASASGLLDEDYGAAAAAFTDSLGGSMDADRAEQRQLEMAAKELAIGDMKTEEERAYNAEQAEQQLYMAAMLEGNTEQGIKTKKLLAAAEQAGGLENITELPIKANGKDIDNTKMKRGAIYTDTVGASNKTFIAVNLSDPAQIKETDSYQEAIAFSNTGG